MKKKNRQKNKKKTTWYSAKINSNVYVSGLPSDITFEEMQVFFKKAGIIRINPLTGK